MLDITFGWYIGVASVAIVTDSVLKEPRMLVGASVCLVELCECMMDVRQHSRRVPGGYVIGCWFSSPISHTGGAEKCDVRWGGTQAMFPHLFRGSTSFGC